jgi:hypothetical protein
MKKIKKRTIHSFYLIKKLIYFYLLFYTMIKMMGNIFSFENLLANQQNPKQLLNKFIIYLSNLSFRQSSKFLLFYYITIKYKI